MGQGVEPFLTAGFLETALLGVAGFKRSLNYRLFPHWLPALSKFRMLSSKSFVIISRLPQWTSP